MRTMCRQRLLRVGHTTPQLSSSQLTVLKTRRASKAASIRSTPLAEVRWEFMRCVCFPFFVKIVMVAFSLWPSCWPAGLHGQLGNEAFTDSLAPSTTSLGYRTCTVRPACSQHLVMQGNSVLAFPSYGYSGPVAFMCTSALDMLPGRLKPSFFCCVC